MYVRYIMKALSIIKTYFQKEIWLYLFCFLFFFFYHYSDFPITKNIKSWRKSETDEESTCKGF